MRNNRGCINYSLWIVSWFFAVTALLGLVGRHGDPYAYSYTRQKPNAAELNGTYVLTEQTLDAQSVSFLRTRYGKSFTSTPTLQLLRGGKFIATNIPQWYEIEPGNWTIKSFKSGTGDWMLQGGSSDGWWSLKFSSSNIKIPNLDYPDVDLLGESAPHKILFKFADDPDQDEAMTFEKKPIATP